MITSVKDLSIWVVPDAKTLSFLAKARYWTIKKNFLNPPHKQVEKKKGVSLYSLILSSAIFWNNDKF